MGGIGSVENMVQRVKVPRVSMHGLMCSRMKCYKIEAQGNTAIQAQMDGRVAALVHT